MKTLGDRIRHFRELKGMSQQDLAARSGVSQATISDLEGNKQEATRKIFEIATALEIPVAALAPNDQVSLEDVRDAIESPLGKRQIDIDQAMAVVEGAMLSAGLDPRHLGALRELLIECLEEPLILSNPQSEADSRRNMTRSAFSRFLRTHNAQGESK